MQGQYEIAMRPLLLLPLDESVAPVYATLRSHLEAAGTPIGPNDTLIAAHALALGATLVSADAEFARVPGLKLENWLS
jgi:tRNA(fMet)-specific endonuclease VapC